MSPVEIWFVKLGGSFPLAKLIYVFSVQSFKIKAVRSASEDIRPTSLQISELLVRVIINFIIIRGLPTLLIALNISQKWRKWSKPLSADAQWASS